MYYSNKNIFFFTYFIKIKIKMFISMELEIENAQRKNAKQITFMKYQN